MEGHSLVVVEQNSGCRLLVVVFAVETPGASPEPSGLCHHYYRVHITGKVLLLFQ